MGESKKSPRLKPGGRGFARVEIPVDIDWLTHRVATSDRYSDSLSEIEEKWSLLDLLKAHAVLDMLETAKPETE